MLIFSNYIGNFNKAYGYNREAFELVKKLKRIDLEIDVINNLADGFWYSSDYDKGFKAYYAAYKLADSIHDKRNIAFSLYNLGWIACIQQKNYDDVHYLYEQPSCRFQRQCGANSG